MPLSLGTRLSHYEIRTLLGAGGMGEVYLAHDTTLDRTVALKLLPADVASDGQRMRRFVQEAKAASALNHPNILTIHEIGQTDSTHFIATEFIDGVTLREHMKSTRMTMSEVLDVAMQTASALAAAHAAGVIHRDIKPENIMLRRDGYIKVLDFGLAKLTERQAALSEAPTILNTEPEVVMGTIGYMSPEQVQGLEVDARTDIFSLGVVLYEMLTARRPFEGESRALVLHALLNYEPLSLGTFRDDVPLELERIIRKALEKKRDERYRSADEMLADLRRLTDEPQRHRDTEGEKDERETMNDELFSGSTSIHRFLRASVPLWLIRLFAALRRNGVRPSLSLPKRAAFRGLLPFQEADRDRFYGREIETSELFNRISYNDFRFGVLYGDSGAGKTSLVRAGLLPKLREQGFLPIYCRSYKDPLAAILEECCKQSQIKTGEGESPVQYLRRVAEEFNAGLVIVCDQFEEFFVNFKTKRERKPFVTFVAACHDAADLPVKFLFSMRSDFLYLIGSEFDGPIPEPLMISKRYHLSNFDEEQAQEIIDRSVRRANSPFEAALLRQVARDLVVNNCVLPSELQIIGEQLQTKRIFTLKDYRRAGGKEPLVHGFLEDVVQGSGNQEAARMLLRSLISDENTRLTLPLKEIVKRTQRSRETIERILKLFVKTRLIREIQEEKPWRYELMHEYLIEKINQITGQVMNATQRANRQFRQYLSQYSVDKSTRIPLSKLWFIKRYSDMGRGERERELLRKSLRWGLLKWSAVAVLLAVGTTLAAAWMSVSEEWEGVRLSDGHTAAVRRAVFSPDGRLLVSGGEDKTVIVWDFERRVPIKTFSDHTDWVTALAFSPDGKWFATGSEDQTVIVWDAARLEKATVLREHRGPVSAVAFSLDGKLLASASYQSDVRTILWEVGRWDKVREAPDGISYGNLLFSPDNRWLTSPHQTWDLATMQQVASASGWGGNWAALSPDGMRIVSVGTGGSVDFWGLTQPGDLTRRKLLGSYPAHGFHGRSVAFSPDGRLVATAADDIVLWDAATQQKRLRIPHTAEVWSLAFSPDGRWLVSGYADGAILLWDVAEGETIANFNQHTASVHSVAFSPDGKRVASASEDRSVIIWDAENRSKEAVLVGHNARVTGVAFSPDGRWVASGGLMNRKVILWDVEHPQSPRTFNDPDGSSSYCLAISPDGRWIATSTGVYESAEGSLVVSSHHPRFRKRGNIYGVAFSVDGQWLAWATEYGQLVLLDTKSWQEVERHELKNTQLITVSFSPDSKWLVTGEDEGAVRLWTVKPLREVAVLGRHEARIRSVAFSPDGQQVASASEDQTIALWDVRRHRLITRIGTHTAPVHAVAFSPDGRRLVSGEHDNSVRIYTRHRTLWGYRIN